MTFITLDVLLGYVSVFLLVAGLQVTLGIFDLKPGLLLDGWCQRVYSYRTT